MWVAMGDKVEMNAIAGIYGVRVCTRLAILKEQK